MLVGDGEVVERGGVGRIDLDGFLPAVDRFAPQSRAARRRCRTRPAPSRRVARVGGRVGVGRQPAPSTERAASSGRSWQDIAHYSDSSQVCKAFGRIGLQPSKPCATKIGAKQADFGGCSATCDLRNRSSERGRLGQVPIIDDGGRAARLRALVRPRVLLTDPRPGVARRSVPDTQTSQRTRRRSSRCPCSAWWRLAIAERSGAERAPRMPSTRHCSVS